MTDDNQDALRCADSVERMDTFTDYQRAELLKSAAHLRRLVRENEEKESALKIVEATCDDFANQIEAKDALLRQAVGALDGWVCNFWSKHDDDATKLIAAIRQHLEGKA